jgi:mRNA interferase MazF
VGPLVKGDVVVLPFPFDDQSLTKRRPALVVAAPPGLSPVMAQITSQTVSDPHPVALNATDFASGNLQKDSFVRTNILVTINPAKVLYRVGTVTPAKMQEVTTRLIQLLTT